MNRNQHNFLLKSSIFVILSVCTVIFISEVNAAEIPAEKIKISVLNPRGNPPPIHLTPLAPRLKTLKGKTVYLVDTRFMGGDTFLKQIQAWFAENMPEVKTVFRQKRGSYGEDDPELWSEIAKKGDAMIIAIGH